jgi:hypothetical protein
MTRARTTATKKLEAVESMQRKMNPGPRHNKSSRTQKKQQSEERLVDDDQDWYQRQADALHG